MFTHTDTTMNTLITTANGGTVSTSVSPRNSVHTEIASFGIPLCQRNTNESDFLIGENDAISFSIKRGGALVMIRLTLDDEDELIILDAERTKSCVSAPRWGKTGLGRKTHPIGRNQKHHPSRSPLLRYRLGKECPHGHRAVHLHPRERKFLFRT